MSTKIYEPKLPRAHAAPLIEQELRKVHATLDQRPYRAQTSTLNGLSLRFVRLDVGVLFNVFDQGEHVMTGKLDPKRPTKSSIGQVNISRWVRGRWEESFGVSVRSYDPHWDDEVPPALKKMIRRAASLPPASNEAKQVVDLMISYADGRFEDVIELTVDGNPDAVEHAGFVINAMRGPNMAATVPLMMWINGAHPTNVLKVYVEAHHKLGVRRRHLREILGTGERVAAFFGYMIGLNKLEQIVEILRMAPANEASGLIAKLAQCSDPVVDQAFPGGVAAYLQRFLTNPTLKVRLVLAGRGRGLFA